MVTVGDIQNLIDEGLLNYIDVFKTIQKSGKVLLVLLNDTRLVEPLLQQLSSRGLYLVVQADSQEEAQDLIKLAYKYTRD